MDEETTVSWTMIEPDWKVFSSDEIQIGEVYLIDGDPNADIFDGLAITHHGGPAILHHRDRPHYVSADQVASIQPGVVRLAITAEEAGHLPEHHVAESAEILPDSASRKERFEQFFDEHLGGNKEK